MVFGGAEEPLHFDLLNDLVGRLPVARAGFLVELRCYTSSQPQS